MKIVDVKKDDMDKLEVAYYDYYAVLDLAQSVVKDADASMIVIDKLKTLKFNLENIKRELLLKYTEEDSIPNDFTFDFDKRQLRY